MFASKLPLVVIYDCDETLYSVDTDSICGSILNFDLSVLRTQFPGWNVMMQHVLKSLHEAGKTPADIQHAFAQFPITPGFEDSVRAWAKAGVPQFIVSDSNSMFIRLTLEAKGLSDIFPPHHIYTNHMSYSSSDGYCMEYHHHNDWTNESPVNMDKAVAVSHLLSRLHNSATQVNKDCISNALSDSHVVPTLPNDMFPCVFRTAASVSEVHRHDGAVLYFGDGIGDYRGSQMLSSVDTFGCRDQYACHKAIAARISSGAPFAASLHPWESAESVKRACTNVAIQTGIDARFVDVQVEGERVEDIATADTIKVIM